MTQIEKIKEKLRSEGSVNRNWALSNFIGRLASRLTDLKDEGWQFKTETVEENGGKNFYYYLLEEPKIPPKPQVTFKETLEGRVAVLTKNVCPPKCTFEVCVHAKE